jgi:protein-ribulosamine 3-kinase
MAPTIDSAIIEALSLNATRTTITTHGGSGFASTYKLTSQTEDGGQRLYFVKMGTGMKSEVMFAGMPSLLNRHDNHEEERCDTSAKRQIGEHASLNAIHDAVPSLCPRSYAHGKLSDAPGSFLVTDFLDLSPRSRHSAPPGSGMSLAQKLAQLHSTPVPVPEGYDTPVFGFPVPTCCGDTIQDNTFTPSWAEFYADKRLRHVLSRAESNSGPDPDLRSLVEKTARVVVPRLLRDGHLKTAEGGSIQPVVVHGDLWSGNHGRGSIAGGPVEEVVFDAAACWGHGEYDFGIMRMFGGFGGEFEREYGRFKGRDEPIGEWEDRVELYEL